jgi:hypothetical protein
MKRIVISPVKSDGNLHAWPKTEAQLPALDMKADCTQYKRRETKTPNRPRRRLRARTA